MGRASSAVRIASTTVIGWRRSARVLTATALTVVSTGTSGCGSTTPPDIPTVTVATVQITNSSVTIERGYHAQLTAVARTAAGATVSVPFTWRSLDEKIVTIDQTGRLFAVDTGSTSVYASSIGPVNSSPIPVRVVFTGPAKIEQTLFVAPAAVSPGATADSLRALVTDLKGNPLSGARVAFAVTAGGGSISPAIAVTKNGIASAEWKLGPVAGLNTATATVLGEDDKPFAFVQPNVTTYSIRTFQAFAVTGGDAQTGLILSALPVNPSVRLVDSLGRPRPGVPVTFTVGNGGSITTAVVSTGADGVASPGAWTLGEVPGEQTLIARTGLASITLKATATGTPVHYTPAKVIAGGGATCAIEADGTLMCFGEQPKVGDSTIINKSVPTPAKTTAKFTSVAASMSFPSHFCGISTERAIYCWGVNSITDTLPAPKSFNDLVPTKVPSNIQWTQAAPGGAHNCALSADQQIYCWGDNSLGQLGDQTNVKHYAPAPVAGGFQFVAATSGALHSCGLTTNGGAFCWGQNSNGQLGDATTINRTSPTAVASGVTFQSIAAGQTFTCALSNTGRAHCWGLLGTGGTILSRTYAEAPIFTSLSAGGFHACALTADGTAYCWGDNSGGQLGDSTLTERQAPVAVATTVKFRSISAGFGHTCGIAVGGPVLCWGVNRAGELGEPPGAARIQPRFIVTKVLP
jgi:alpha-tubulin suppressor-like RCC1 family protein